MNEQILLDLSCAIFKETPFPYFSCSSVLSGGLEKDLYAWLQETDSWSLTRESFYTQFEFSFFDVILPANLQFLASDQTIKEIGRQFISFFRLQSVQFVGLTAHKLVDGHQIGVHNDYIGGDETHRLVIQINPEWNESNGGFLMLFNSPDSKDIATIIRPLNNTAVGFEISDGSYHAVSRVNNFSRYTLVYTFKGERV
jgi:Rps23 Pro-64 3,4-dihydroxylase Tpa1-like proline 4-hydroxylase